MACSQTKVVHNVIQMEVEGENEKPTGRFRRKRLMKATSPQENGLSIGRILFMRKMNTALIVLLATVGEKSCFITG